MKNKFKIIITLVIGVIIGTVGYVVADNIINANQVEYSNVKSKVVVDNVQDAIDELYDMSKTHCPDEYNCHDTKNARVVPATYGETFKAIIYLNPANLSQNCTEATSSIGTGTSGCMKWYAYSETATTYNLILDHNISVENYADSASTITSLKNASGWSDLNVRNLTTDDVAIITGNDSWLDGTNRTTFYLDSNSSTVVATASQKSKYYWLYDYTADCINSGCKNEDSTNHGYWLDDPNNSESNAWSIRYLGSMVFARTTSANRGVRPVITVDKSSLGI